MGIGESKEKLKKEEMEREMKALEKRVSQLESEIKQIKKRMEDSEETVIGRVLR